jgi:hypothetical protein
MRQIIHIFHLLLLLVSPRLIAQSYTLHSSTLNEDRKIQVYLPPGARDSYFFPRRYPVLYIFDGEAYFGPVSQMTRFMAGDDGLGFPEMIVVAISNTDRNRDLSPIGGEAFFSFISHELIPYIDSLCPTAPYRVLAGHSLGGLTVINTLFHHPGYFNAYIAGEPSMFWENSRVLKGLNVIHSPASLFLGIANSPRKDLPAGPFGRDTVMERFSEKHLQAIHELSRLLGQSDLRWSSNYYPQYDHGTSPLAIIHEGLRFLFDFYDLGFPGQKFFEPGFKKDSVIAKHYRDISRRMGYTILPPEPFMNSLGYTLLSQKQFARARYYFQMNIDNYPGSANVYDSMGDFYLAAGEQAKAADAFRKSLAIRETAETRAKLEKIP